jgi:hypothetical protein
VVAVLALGLAVGAGLVLNLILWLDYRAQDEKHQYAKGTDAPNQSQIGQSWDGFIGTFVSPSDTLAQWIMAFFTIAATVVLIFTLRSANKTNIAAVKASKAALEANKIMRAEKRPWAVLQREVACHFDDTGHSGRIAWNYELENKGAGPAHDVKVDRRVIRRHHLQHMRPQLKRYLSQCINHRTSSQKVAVLFPGERTDSRKYEPYSWNRYEDDEFTGNASFFREGTYFMLMVCVTYRLSEKSDDFGFDVRMFGIERTERFIGPWAHTILEHADVRLIG